MTRTPQTTPIKTVVLNWSQNYNPVCGKNGKDYANKCLAICEKVEIASKGPCNGYPLPPPARDCPDVCPFVSFLALYNCSACYVMHSILYSLWIGAMSIGQL